LSDNQAIIGRGCVETKSRVRAGELAWGREYLMVEPEHFRVDYAINPYMDPRDQP
jgi:hypothetical protein